MTKLFLLFIVIVTTSPLMADSCFPLYQAKADKIRKDGAHTTTVGAHIYVLNGELGYWPGVKVPGHVENWSQDLIDAIKWEPYFFTNRHNDPKKEWLESFRKAIRKDCKLPRKDYDHLRAMLKELMEDGSFCPNNQILEPKLLKGKSSFKNILKQAVKDQRFTQYCQDKSIVDESHREIKDIGNKAKVKSKAGAGKQ